jgi:hypothetical protein
VRVGVGAPDDPAGTEGGEHPEVQPTDSGAHRPNHRSR